MGIFSAIREFFTAIEPMPSVGAAVLLANGLLPAGTRVAFAAGDPQNGLAPGSLDGLERFAPDRFEDGRLDPRYALDAGIRHYVLILRSQGIDTCQSCQGGPGHAYLEPTIEFRGGVAEGPRAVGAALTYGLPIAALRREWAVRDHQIEGPVWSITFSVRADIWLERDAARTAAYFKRHATGRDAC